jgi:hypothetical protein
MRIVVVVAAAASGQLEHQFYDNNDKSMKMEGAKTQNSLVQLDNSCRTNSELTRIIFQIQTTY